MIPHPDGRLDRWRDRWVDAETKSGHPMTQHLSHQSQQSFQVMSPWGDCQCCRWLAGHRQRAHRVISVQTRFTTDTSTRVPLRYIIVLKAPCPKVKAVWGWNIACIHAFASNVCIDRLTVWRPRTLGQWARPGNSYLPYQRPSQHVHQNHSAPATNRLCTPDFVAHYLKNQSEYTKLLSVMSWFSEHGQLVVSYRHFVCRIVESIRS